MIEPLNDLSIEATIRAIEKNLFEYSAYIGSLRNAQILDSSDLSWVLTDDPVFNRVLHVHLSDHVEQRVKMIVDSLKKRSLPVTWLVSPSSVPANLSENLKENGLVFQGTWRGMAIDPAKNPGLVKYFHPKFKVCKVTNQADLNTWINLACESFGFSPHIKFTYNHVFKRFPLENRSAWEFYLVYIDAQPVATGSIFYDGDTAGIYWMATLPQFRRIGIGTHLASYLVQAAYQRGYHFVILHATVEGYPVYQRIGFKDYCQLNIYTWKPRYAGLTFSKYFLTEFAGIVNFKKIKNYLKLR